MLSNGGEGETEQSTWIEWDVIRASVRHHIHSEPIWNPVNWKPFNRPS